MDAPSCDQCPREIEGRLNAGVRSFAMPTAVISGACAENNRHSRSSITTHCSARLQSALRASQNRKTCWRCCLWRNPEHSLHSALGGSLSGLSACLLKEASVACARPPPYFDPRCSSVGAPFCTTEPAGNARWTLGYGKASVASVMRGRPKTTAAPVRCRMRFPIPTDCIAAGAIGTQSCRGAGRDKANGQMGADKSHRPSDKE